MAPVPGPDGKAASLEGGQEETFSQGSSLFYQSSMSKETFSFSVSSSGKVPERLGGALIARRAAAMDSYLQTH